MNKWIIATCVAVGIALAAVAWAEPSGRGQGFRGGPGQGPGGGQPGRGIEALLNNSKLAGELGVTDEQITALKKAAYEHRKKEIKLRSDFELARLEVRNLVQAEPTDEDAIMAAVDEAGKVGVEVRKAQIGFMLQVREIVGADTLKKMRELRREHQQDRQGGREGRQEGNQRGSRGGQRDRGNDQGSPGFSRSDRPGDDDGESWSPDDMPPPDDDEDVSQI